MVRCVGLLNEADFLNTHNYEGIILDAYKIQGKNMKQTIRFEIEDNLLHSLEKIAAQWNMSVTQYFQCLILKEIATQNENRNDEQLRQEALAELRQGFNLGGQPAPKESLYSERDLILDEKYRNYP